MVPSFHHVLEIQEAGLVGEVWPEWVFDTLENVVFDFLPVKAMVP